MRSLLYRGSNGKFTDVGDDIVTLQSHEVPRCERFKYLGSIFSKDGEIVDDVTHRIQVGCLKRRRASGVLCDRKIPTKLKWKFYRTAIRPAMLYSTECWAAEKQHVNKMGVAVVKRSDRIIVKGHTRGRGRPKLTLEAVIQKDMRVLNITEHDAFDRAHWKNRIHVADPI